MNNILDNHYKNKQNIINDINNNLKKIVTEEKKK